MSKFVHNRKAAAQVYHNNQKQVGLQLEVGINKISDEEYEMFKAKIDADPLLTVTENLTGDVPQSIAPVIEQVEDAPVADEEKPLEAGTSEDVGSSDAPQAPKEGRGKRK